jgi:ssDNA-binding Zn-finger/Zn-ribbon topoisomerase 1
MTEIKHFSNCKADYPEKPIGEKPQEIIKIEIDNNEIVHQCSDCGAFIIMVKTND